MTTADDEGAADAARPRRRSDASLEAHRYLVRQWVEAGPAGLASVWIITNRLALAAIQRHF